MKRLSLLLVLLAAVALLVTVAAQGQTLYTCGSKHADPKHCMAAKLCVTSISTHKTYCGATMAAAEAQAMSHEPQTIHSSGAPLFDRACIGNACPFDDALVCAISGAPEEVIIPYCDQVLGTDDECVMRKGQWKKFQNDSTRKQRDFSIDDSLEHEALIALGECLQRERNK